MTVITTPFWAQDGMLAGARFDAKIDAGNNTRMKLGTIGNPVLSSDDADTPANELRMHLTNVTSGAMFPMGDLLGSGMASDEGSTFIDEAVKAIEKVQADLTALLALDTKPGGFDLILDGQWNKLKEALDDVFGTDSMADAPTSAVRLSTPREEDILDDIADVLDALASEEAFVAATADGGGGVLASRALGASAAASAFNRLTWTAGATLGMTGSTRYGTAVRKTSANATKGPATDVYGAFSYATMEETQRTADAAAVSLTGIASYAGGTHAVNSDGKAYSGMMQLQVRFKANSVSGVVSGLEDSDGLAWQHNFADVDRIVLDDATLLRNATWSNTAGSNANVFYTVDSGLLRPVGNQTNTFAGILLGRGADAGSEASGTWSIGTAGGSGYLAGGFGVEHVADAARPVPDEDDGSAAGATLFSMAADGNAAINMTSASIGSGMLTVKQRAYGYRDATDDATDNVLYGYLSAEYDGAAGDGSDDSNPTLITAKFDLAAMAEAGTGASTPVNGPTWISGVVSVLEQERDLLSTLQGLSSADTQGAEEAAWGRVQDELQYRMLGNLPLKMADAYTDLESESDAIDLINRAIDALSSNDNLAAALDPDGTGIFDHYDTNADGDPAVVADEDITDFVDSAGKVNGRTVADMRSEKAHQVIATLGTTSYTRFGAWRRQSTENAIRTNGLIATHGGPGTFAYSPLDPTNAGTPLNTGFPEGGSASYTGETVALQGTTILMGTVRVDVTWVADADSGTTGTFDANLGTMSLTISGLASAVGSQPRRPPIRRSQPTGGSGKPLPLFRWCAEHVRQLERGKSLGQPQA